MLKIRTSPLPEETTQVRSLRESVHAALNVRYNLISQMHSYPYPSHVVAEIRRRCDLSSLETVLDWMITMRDIARYASDALKQLNFMKIEKQILDNTNLVAYLAKHQRDMGYSHLSSDDIELCANLIIAGEAQNTGWTLDLNPSNSFLAKIYALYRTTAVPAAPPRFSHKDNVIAVSNPITVYDPILDDISTLDQLLYPDITRRALTEPISVVPGEKKDATQARQEAKLGVIEKELASWNTTLQHEGVIQSLINIRIIDHIFALFMDTEVWMSFISPRHGADEPGKNAERSKSLARMAGYFQLMLNYAHIFRYEAFRITYNSFESWHGQFPELPPFVEANYQKYVAKYDVFNAKQDVLNLFACYGGRDKNLETKVHVFFEELVQNYGISGTIQAIADKSNVYPTQIQHLGALADPAMAAKIMSFPLSAVKLLQPALERVLSTQMFESVTRTVTNSLQGAFTAHVTDDILREVMALNLKPFSTWHGHLASSNDVFENAPVALSRGNFPTRAGVLPSSATWKQIMEKQYTLTIGSANGLFNSAAELKNVIYDSTRAAEFEVALAKGWRMLGPSTMFTGSNSVTTSELTLNSDSLERFLERMTGDHITAIRLTMTNPFNTTIWATYLSSCALLFRNQNGVYPVPGISTKAGVAPVATLPSDALSPLEIGDLGIGLILEEGHGAPYGLSYSGLLDLQRKQKDFKIFPIAGTDLAIGFLVVAPGVSADLATATFSYEQPYMYFAADVTQTYKSDRLVEITPMAHFAFAQAFRHQFETNSMVIFTKTHAYGNDMPFMHIVPSYVMKTTPEASEVASIPLSERTWTGARTAAFNRFITFGPYGSAAQAPVIEEGATSDTLSQAIIDFEKEVQAAASPAQNPGLKKRETPTTDKMEGKVSSAIKNLDESIEFSEGLVAKPSSKNKKRKNQKGGSANSSSVDETKA